MKRMFLSAAMGLFAIAVQAEVTLPGWMTSNMVLQ